MRIRFKCRDWIAALCCVISVGATAAQPRPMRFNDALEPARAALRTLQFDKAIEWLRAAGNAGNADAEYLLALIYLNGVGVAADAGRAHTLLQRAAEHGQGAAAYVLAAELMHASDAAPDASHQWLERSAKLGYARAAQALQSHRPLLDREAVGAADPILLTAWVIDCARNNDAAELRRLGPASVGVRDEFGRGALSYAAAAGSVAAAAALLEMGADLRTVDKAGTTALMIAAERADTGVTDLLLRNGADPQTVDSEQRTALFYAARSNRGMTVRALQRAGAILDARDSRGYNALDDALAVGADAAATELRSRGAHASVVTVAVGRQSGKFDLAHPGEIYRGWPPLALAVSRNDVAAVQQLLDAGADVNLRVPQGDTLLQVAAAARATGSLRLLLAGGVNTSATDHAGHSALWLAATRGDVAMAKTLLNAGVMPDAHAATEQASLLAAVRVVGSHDVAQALLNAGASPEVADARGHTALMLAAATGQVVLVNLLLAHHARTDAEDHEGRTALWYAASIGSTDEVVALLASGAIREAADARGLTALHAAAAQKEIAVLLPLLPLSARLNTRSAGGDTPLLIAAAMGHAHVVQVLLTKKPDLDVQNNAGDTALIAASRGGYTTVCQLLLTAGANRSLRNGARVSAADIATGRGFSSLAKELAGKG